MFEINFNSQPIQGTDAYQSDSLSAGTTQLHTDSLKILPSQIVQHGRFCPHDVYNPVLQQAIEEAMSQRSQQRKKKSRSSEIISKTIDRNEKCTKVGLLFIWEPFHSSPRSIQNEIGIRKGSTRFFISIT